MKIKTFGRDKITSYKIKIKDKIVMLDFDGENINQYDVKDVDYIFFSHCHTDHFLELLNYDVAKHLKENVKIYATSTTGVYIQEYASAYFQKQGYTDKKIRFYNKLFEKMENVYFNEEIELDGFKVQVYPSGHTFGSAMLLFTSSESTILYTGDMDDGNEEIGIDLQFPNAKVDYIIADGTNLLDTEYKGVSLNQVKNYINRQKSNEPIYYYAHPEKAVLYAFALSKKMDDVMFFYDDEICKKLKIFWFFGYNLFKEGKILSISRLEKYEDNKKIKKVIFTSNQLKYNIDYKLSLHMTKNRFEKHIEQNIFNKPKILIGHYNFEKAKNNISLGDNVLILEIGENDV